MGSENREQFKRKKDQPNLRIGSLRFLASPKSAYSNANLDRDCVFMLLREPSLFHGVILEEEEPFNKSGRYCNVVCANETVAKVAIGGLNGDGEKVSYLGTGTLYGIHPVLQTKESLEETKKIFQKIGVIEILN